MRESVREKRIAAAVATAKAAFAAGKLDGYKPLAATGAGAAKSTCTTSWGPAMRR